MSKKTRPPVHPGAILREEFMVPLGLSAYALAKEFYASRGQAISEQTAFENVDAIATTQYFAQRRGLARLPRILPHPRLTPGRQARAYSSSVFRHIRAMTRCIGPRWSSQSNTLSRMRVAPPLVHWASIRLPPPSTGTMCTLPEPRPPQLVSTSTHRTTDGSDQS